MACLHDLSRPYTAALGSPRSAGSLAPGHGPCAMTMNDHGLEGGAENVERAVKALQVVRRQA